MHQSSGPPVALWYVPVLKDEMRLARRCSKHSCAVCPDEVINGLKTCSGVDHFFQTEAGNAGSPPAEEAASWPQPAAAVLAALAAALA